MEQKNVVKSNILLIAEVYEMLLPRDILLVMVNYLHLLHHHCDFVQF